MHRGYGVDAEEDDDEPGTWVIRVFVSSDTSERRIFNYAERKAAAIADEQGAGGYRIVDWDQASSQAVLRRGRRQASVSCGGQGQQSSSECRFGSYGYRFGQGHGGNDSSRGRSRSRRSYNAFTIILDEAVVEPSPTEGGQDR